MNAINRFIQWIMLPRNVRFNRKKVLSRNNHTKTFEGKYDKKTVAVKRISPSHYDVYEEELSPLKNGENLHENVSQIFAVESNHKYFFIVSELSEMNLEKYVIDIKESFQLRKEFGAKEVLLQACKGLNHLHQLNIIHRNIRPSHILIVEQNGKKVVKISDFGVSRMLTESENCSSDGWLPPETLEAKITSKASDMFSMGLVIYFVVSKGFSPIKVTTETMPKRKSHKFERDYHHLEKKPSTDNMLAIDLVKGLTELNINTRMTAGDVLVHPFFWSDLKCISFLLDVASYIDQKFDKSKLLADKLNQDEKKVIGSNWVDQIDKCLIEEKHWRNNLVNLIELISHKCTYPYSPEAIEILGKSANTFWAYWINKFPLLFPHIYETVKIHARHLLMPYFDPAKVYTKPIIQELFLNNNVEHPWKKSEAKSVFSFFK